MFEQTKYIWLNGEIIEWSDARIHISNYALHYGVGVFEGIRAYETEKGTAVFRMKEHLDRFYKSAKVYSLEIPYTEEELSNAICETIAKNDFRFCYIRPMVYTGSGDLGIRANNKTETAILCWESMAHRSEETLARGIRATVSPWHKIDSTMIPSTAKATGQYISSKLTINDAMSRGFDAALLLNKDGYIAEGSVENIFIVKNGCVKTNDERSSILMGITRDSVLQIANDLGFKTEVGFLTLEELHDADEAFFTGTAAEIAPIREVDDQTIGEGKPGAITKQLQETFSDIVHGRNQSYNHWLCEVSSEYSLQAA
jgi:branched-chain amino acid aminotransferase